MKLLKLSKPCNVENLQFLELSHCKIKDSLFNQIPDKCAVFKIFLLQDCQEITEEINSHFKTHCYLKILNVAGNREAIF